MAVRAPLVAALPRCALVLLAVCGGASAIRAAGAAAETNALVPRLQQLTQRTRDLPFAEVLLATTGRRLLPLDTNAPAHARLHAALRQAAAEAGAAARQAGLRAARANEAGNQMEAFVKAALKSAGLEARTPVRASGGAQVVGYPDVEIAGEPHCYLELKTYSATTANTTQRSFYFSPSDNPKITRDAVHLLLAFELERTERDGQTVFVPVAWKLVSLEQLRVDLKFEFNQSNRGLYGPANAAGRLGQGAVK